MCQYGVQYVMVRVQHGTVRSDHMYGKIQYGYGTMQKVENCLTFCSKGSFWLIFTKGGRRRTEKGVFLKCSQSMRTLAVPKLSTQM